MNESKVNKITIPEMNYIKSKICFSKGKISKTFTYLDADLEALFLDMQNGSSTKKIDSYHEDLSLLNSLKFPKINTN